MCCGGDDELRVVIDRDELLETFAFTVMCSMNPTSETGVRGEGKTKFQARNMPLLHVAWKNVFSRNKYVHINTE